MQEFMNNRGQAGQTYAGTTAVLGGAATNSLKERDPTALESLERDLDQVANRLGNLNGRLSDVVIRAFGPRPESIQGKDGAPCPQPISSVARLHAQAARLHSYLAYAEEEMARLEQL